MFLLFRFSKNKFIRKNYFVNKFQKTYKHYNYNKKIHNLRNYEPSGLIHINCLAKLLKRTINVQSQGQIRSFGKYLEKLKINVEYIDDSANDHLRVGHYALENQLEASADYRYPNNCLFDAIAPQIGVEANLLRQIITRRIRRKLKNRCLIKSSTTNISSFTYDILGGARYTGKFKKDVKRILDLSQKGESHPNKKRGHSRGHASNPKTTGFIDSVENYSKNTWKTGFLSTSDQDFLAHLALKDTKSQNKIEQLNETDIFRVSVSIPVKDLDLDKDELPKMQEWLNGKKMGDPYQIKQLKLVMEHFYNKHKDRAHDVFILTFYPES